MIFVGMDVHVRNSFFHATDETGRRLGHRRCSNEPGELAAFCRELVAKNKGECAPTRVVLESTTNSRAMQRMIREAATLCGEPVTVDVLDARRLRIIAESVCKTDGIDAKVLCDLARSNFDLPKCYMPDDEEFALREHLRARSDLVRMRTMVKNRIHAVLHRRGILSPRNGLFTIAGRDFLQEATLDEAGRTILERYLVLLDGLEKRIDESTKDLRILMRSDRWAKPASLLQTMPGIGLITALVILAELKCQRSRVAMGSQELSSRLRGVPTTIKASSSTECLSGSLNRTEGLVIIDFLSRRVQDLKMEQRNDDSMFLSEALRRNAVDLSASGIIGTIWERNCAVSAIDEATKSLIAVLGGEVLVSNDGRVINTYDSWYIRKKSENEDWNSFVSRANSKALDYVLEYSERGRQIYYLLVFSSMTRYSKLK